MSETNDFEIIHSYSRAQAIADGVLVDVADTAKEAGFVIPVAITREVWDEIVAPNPAARLLGQSEAGRLWDVLWMLRYAIRSQRGGDPSRLLFQLIVQHGDQTMGTVTLKSICGPGDEGEPVITVMGRDED